MLPPVDVRRKRPPALSFLLRMETLRRASRVISLLALDFAGLLAALIVALMVKAVLRDGQWAWDASLHEARETIAFVYLVTVLLFARSGLYAERAQRPGLARIVSSLFQVAVVSLIFALVNGTHDYTSYYIFYGSLFFAVIILGSARWGYEMLTGAILRAAGYRRRAVLVGTGQPHRGGRARADRRGARAGRDGRLHLADAAAGQRAALAGPDRGRRRGARRLPRAGSDHRRPGLPAGARRRPRGYVPSARRDGPDRAVDDGDPRPARRVRPGRVGAAVRAAPAGVRRRRLLRQADVRPRRLGAAADRARAVPGRDRRDRALHVARADHLPLLPAGDRRRDVRLPEVPHDVLGRRRAPGRPRVAERGLGRRCSRSAATRG